MSARVVELLRREPADLGSEEGRAQERLRRAALTTLASVAAKAIAMAANLISVPLTLNYLGAERFGLWVTISSANALLEFADLGLGNGLLNVVASAGARGRHEELRKYVSSASYMLLAIAALGAAAFYTMSPWLPWDRVFSAQSAGLIPDARRACAAFVACFALSLPLGIVRRVQMGFQEGFASNLWQCLASVLSLGTLLAAIRLSAGLPVLVLCLMGAPAVALALNWIVEFQFHRRWLMPSMRLFEWTAGARLMRDGLLFLTLQIGSLSLSAADPLIAASYLGLSGAGDFAVAQRLFTILFAMQSMWLMPLWPAYGEAVARGDRNWVRRTLFRTTAAAVAFSALACTVLLAFRETIFSLWLHRSWAPPLSLCLPLALCTVALSAGLATSMYLNGINAIREQAGVAVILTVVVIGLKIWFCQLFGAAGIPWGMFLGYTAIMTPFLIVLIRRRLRAVH